MFKRPGSVSKSAFGVNYDSSRQQPAGNAPRADGPPSKRARTEQLPAEQVRRELLYLVENHATVVVVGETGCGKTTQIPRFLHEAGWTADGYQVGGRGHPFWLSLWGGGVCYMDIFAKQQWHCPPGSSQVNLVSCDPPRWFAPPTLG
jgi:hypothetical protein